MLGTGIKNAILLFLIILILHFLIKNTLMDKKPEGFSSLSSDKELNHKKEKKVEFNIEKTTPSLKPSSSMEDKKKELFDFVMMDDEPSTKEGFVEPNDKFHNELPVACDAKRIMNDEDPIIKKSKNAKDKTLHGDYLVIHEYEDESSLNGGSLLGGLSGFDSYDTMYQEYKCGA
jgi:hypothetical protein